MKTIAYTALHYGRDYLYWAIRSVIDHVDEYHVLYTPIGSHGHRTDVPCPDTRDELYSKAEMAAKGKLRWHEGVWDYEGQQRESIWQYVSDADLVLVLDADEIWSDRLVNAVIQHAYTSGEREIRVPIIHFWRSFHRCVLHDPAYPVRAIALNQPWTDRFAMLVHPTLTMSEKPICHMGYAQRPEIVGYKQHTHGHKGEWRRDCDWFRDKYLANAQTDTHPVGSEYWNPEAVNPADYMPEFMKSHPYWALEVIE